MLGWALTFLVIAIIAGVFGFGGIAVASAGIAKIIFYVFLLLLVVSLVAHFFRNNGDGTFTRITQGGFQVNGDYNLGVSAVDYDNDGYLDLIVAAGGTASSPRRVTLFHNNGDGTFSRVNAGGITNQLGYFFSADWADYDNDGFVDLLHFRQWKCITGNESLVAQQRRRNVRGSHARINRVGSIGRCRCDLVGL